MDFVGRYLRLVRNGVRMAISAARTIFHCIPAEYSLSFTMHLVSHVAGNTVHPFLGKMNVPADPLIITEVFITDAAAVAGKASGLHGRAPLEKVTIQQAPSDGLRATYMALPATGVTTQTVLFHGRPQLFRQPAFSIYPQTDNPFIRCKGYVQAISVISGYLRMARTARFAWIRKCGVDCDTLMRLFKI